MANSTVIKAYWREYRQEVVFGIVLAVLVGTSTWFSQYIPDKLFDHVLTPALNVCTLAVAFSGAWVIFRHTEGLLLRRLWGYALVLWGLGDLSYLVCYLVAPMQFMNMAADHLTTYELLFGNLLGWVMVLYPTEALRPGWLTWKIVLWQLVPLFALVALDYLVPLNLWPVVALYPYILLVQVLTHIRAYRVWCEENYSSMDNIDVQWIVRYCIMLFIVGANYVYMCSTHGHARGFTQQWFVIFMLGYSTEQILFRKNPWTVFPANDSEQTDTLGEPLDETRSDAVQLLQQWMETEKPYLNAGFQLMDLRAVLPMNRTYLSRFIRDAFGCSFYQFVNNYRIEEAKRLMTEQPELKTKEVARLSGFSSSTLFTRVFSSGTGHAPKEWKQKHA